MSTGRPAHSQDQLQSLPPHLQGETQITAHLASRFHVQLPVSYISSQAIVSFNTYTNSAKSASDAKDASAQSACEDLATRAFTRLGVRQENQAILFL